MTALAIGEGIDTLVKPRWRETHNFANVETRASLSNMNGVRMFFVLLLPLPGEMDAQKAGMRPRLNRSAGFGPLPDFAGWGGM